MSKDHKEELIDLTADHHTSDVSDALEYIEDMQINVSTYLSYISLMHTSAEVLGYLLTAKRMPAKYKKYVNQILAYATVNDPGRLPKNVNSAGDGKYTEQEAKSLAFGLLLPISEDIMHSSVREYFNRKLQNQLMDHKSIRKAEKKIHNKLREMQI